MRGLILDEMDKCISRTREDRKPQSPFMERIVLSREQSHLINSKPMWVDEIKERTGAIISIKVNEPEAFIFAHTGDAIEKGEKECLNSRWIPLLHYKLF